MYDMYNYIKYKRLGLTISRNLRDKKGRREDWILEENSGCDI